jgi:hypothetical protein
LTVQGHRQDARDSGLSDPAVAAEDVPVRDAPLFQCIFQRTSDMILADNVRKPLGTIFTREYLVAHKKT